MIFHFQEILSASNLCYPDLALSVDVSTVMASIYATIPNLISDEYVHNVKKKKGPTISLMLDNDSVRNGTPV